MRTWAEEHRPVQTDVARLVIELSNAKVTDFSYAEWKWRLFFGKSSQVLLRAYYRYADLQWQLTLVVTQFIE